MSIHWDIYIKIQERKIKDEIKLKDEKWTHIQRKGILTKNDLKWRLKFSWKVCLKLLVGVVGFCLDGTSFTYKMNPFDQASAQRAVTWREPGLGFDFGFTRKESHGGTRENVAHFMTAISYRKGVIAME